VRERDRGRRSARRAGAGRARARRAARALTRGFAVGFFFAREVGFGRLQARLGLFERDFCALRIERREQLTLRHMRSLSDLDAAHRAARLEAEVQFARGRDVAAARDRRLNDAALRRDDARLRRALPGGRPDEQRRSDDRAGEQRAERIDDPGCSGACAHDLRRCSGAAVRRSEETFKRG
jgi:hypothetical protein